MSASDKKHYQILVKGKIRGAGFRNYVEDIADSLELTGYVRNQSSQEVAIVIEGEEGTITAFIQSIPNISSPVKIKSLEVTEYPYSGKNSEFTIMRSEMMDEFIDGFDSILYYLQSINQKLDRVLK